MCVAAGTALAIASIGATAVGTFQQMQAQRAQGAYRQQVMNARAQENERSAREAILAAREDEQAKRLETGRLRAEQIARYAAAGYDVSQGSPLRVGQDTAFFGEIDALRIRNRGARQAESLYRQAEVDRYSGGLARSSANRASFGTLLTGAGRVARQYYGFQREGAF